MHTQDMNAWLTETFERNRRLYAGFSMELEEPVIDPPVEGEEVVEDEAEDAPDEEIPAEVLRVNLTKANQEAAKYRKRLREVEASLEGRKTDEDIEELLSGLKSTHANEARDLLIENVALKHNLPVELAELLKGNTREELDAHATALAKFAPAKEADDVPPGDLNGGLNPGNDSGSDGLSARERVRQIKGR